MVNFDELGPEKIIEVYDPKTNLHGFLVIDNTNLGPGKGGIRMTKNVTLEDKKIVISGLTFAARATGLLADELELDLKNLKKKVETFRELQGNAKDLARDASSSRKGIDTLDVEVDVLYKKLSELLS